jgi:hypothetical protein
VVFIEFPSYSESNGYALSHLGANRVEPYNAGKSPDVATLDKYQSLARSGVLGNEVDIGALGPKMNWEQIENKLGTNCRRTLVN